MGENAVPSGVATHALDVLDIGVIVTDGHARRLYTNATADRLLRDPAVALRCCTAGRITPVCHEARAGLHALIASICIDAPAETIGAGVRCAAQRTGSRDRAAVDSNYILVSSKDDDHPDLSIRVLAIMPFADDAHPSAGSIGARHAMILVRPIERECDLEIEAKCLFGLSRAEARLASKLAGGLSLQEAAVANAVTLATARSHLKSVFRKTGLNRQSQLVAVLRSAQIPVVVERREAMEIRRPSVTASMKSRGIPLPA